jgi:hypothetical protein
MRKAAPGGKNGAAHVENPKPQFYWSAGASQWIERLVTKEDVRLAKTKVACKRVSELQMALV